MNSATEALGADTAGGRPARLAMPGWYWPAGLALLVLPFAPMAPGWPDWLRDQVPAVTYAIRLVIEGVAVLWASGRADLPRPMRLALRLLGFTSLASALENLLRFASQLGVPIWGPAYSSAYILLSYLLDLVVLLTLPRRRPRPGQMPSVIVDLMVSVGAVAVVSWLFVTAPAVARDPQDYEVLVYGLALLVLVGGLNVLVVLGEAVPSRRAFWCFVGGHAMYLPSLYLEQLIVGRPNLSFVSEAAYFWGVPFTMAAAVFIRGDRASPAPRGGSPRWMLDLNPIALLTPVALGAVLLKAVASGRNDLVGPLAIALVAVALLLVVRVALSARELLDRQRAERAAEVQVQAAKMQGIGLLAGGIAHEFNNLMATVVSTASLGASEVEESSQAKEDFETIRLAGQRAATLTKQLLNFSGRQLERRIPLDLAQVVERLRPRLSELAGKQVSLQIDLAAVPRVSADSDQMDSLVLQLARNGCQAMPDGGVLGIETRRVVLTRPRESPFLSAPAGEFVALTVSDTGSGIAPEVLPRIFEPFFSTRPIFDAKGLGLAEVHGIVASLRGGLDVESGPGRGSRFTVLLPVPVEGAP